MSNNTTVAVSFIAYLAFVAFICWISSNAWPCLLVLLFNVSNESKNERP